MKNLIATLGAIAFAAVALAGEITVTGNGRISLQPDKMKLVVTVSTTNPDIADGKRVFEEKKAVLAATFAAAGVASNEVVTAGMDMSPEIDYVNGKMVRNGYRFSEEFTFVAKVDRERLGRISSALFDCKAVESVNTLFELFDPESPRSEARALAVKNARAIAEGIAEAAGVELADVAEIVYGSDGNGGYRVMKNLNYAAVDETGGTSAALRDIEISDSVRIKWKLK